MNFPGREQQHIARPADKLFAVVVDHPLAANRQIENIAFHTQRAVDKEIQVSLRLNRRQAGDQMSVKRVARQQRIVLRFGHTRGSPRRYQWHQLSIFIILSLSALSRLRRRWEFGEKPAQQAKKRQQRAFHRDMPGNKSVYKYGRKVHIEYLHGVTLCKVTAK